jgi:hypothetical protein
MRGLEMPILKCLDSNHSSKRDFVVMCSSCKRVKDNEGYWKNLDGFRKIVDMVLSHGLCPQCAEKYSAQIMELVEARRKTECILSC